MLNLKHLKRIFNNVCEGKSGYRHALKGIFVQADKITATDAYILYECKTTPPAILIDKIITRDSKAIENETLFIMGCNNGSDGQNQKEFWSFEDEAYPKVDAFKPKINEKWLNLKFKKQQLIDLLTAFDGEVLQMSLDTEHVGTPLVIQSEDLETEYALMMPRK